MLTRIYVDNYGCLIDFEYSPGKLNILAGHRGTGRTTLLEVLERLGQFITGGSKYTPVRDALPMDKCTAWQQRPVQTFEVEIATSEDRYAYRLQIEHGSDELDSKLVKEELVHDGEQLFVFEDGIGRLRDESRSFTKVYTSEGNGSVMRDALNVSRHGGLLRFCQWWEVNPWIILPGREDMVNHSHEEIEQLHITGDNLGSWYRYEARTRPDRVAELDRALAALLERFVRLQLVNDQEGRSMCFEAVFDHPIKGKVAYEIESLSSREQLLIQLYSLAYLALRPDRSVCIDAPRVALEMDELRQWLGAVVRSARVTSCQVFVVVNQLELTDDLPAGSLTLFERPDQGPATVTQR